MRAMILAAGLGTRLRPLSNDRPKALVEVAGRTLLEVTLRRLASSGIREVIVNAHHFADLIIEYLRKNDNFGMQIEVSREDVLLDTGGGLKKAAGFFEDDAESFILHNVDVISSIDLREMLEFHSDSHALATLAMQDRDTARYLLFDEHDRLCGRRKGREGVWEMARPAEEVKALAFCGIHVIAPGMLPLMQEQGVFSIIDSYLRLTAAGENIAAFRADQYYWRDLGKPENVVQAERDVERGIIRL